MRKGQSFTPARLERWRLSGRGTGIGADYQPWHQVTRDDPGSRGRSHLLRWRFGRLHHLLSDLERLGFIFASMLPYLVDLREQFPLAHEIHEVEVAAYRADKIGQVAPGTLEIAKDVGVRHPMTRRYGVQTPVPWVMTTDLLLTLSGGRAGAELFAVSLKYPADLEERRARELLQIERAYWAVQGVPWILVTPSQYDGLVERSLLNGLPFIVGEAAVASHLIEGCAALKDQICGRPATHVQSFMVDRLGVHWSEASRVFWQAVWSGRLPVNLSRRSWIEGLIEVISPPRFWEQNPLAVRRSEWSL